MAASSSNGRQDGNDWYPQQILFVDDDDLIRDSVVQALRYRGLSVIPCPSKTEALKWLESSPFAIVISDFHLGSSNGVEVLQHAMNLQPSAIRILISGRVDMNSVFGSASSDVVQRFVVKPWAFEELFQVIHGAFEVQGARSFHYSRRPRVDAESSGAAEL